MEVHWAAVEVEVPQMVHRPMAVRADLVPVEAVAVVMELPVVMAAREESVAAEEAEEAQVAVAALPS